MNKSAPEPSSVTPSAAILIAAITLIAFLAGAGSMWLMMRTQRASDAKQPPVFIAQSPAGALDSSDSAPPDVSQLSPASAEVALGNWNYDRRNWATAMQHYQRALSTGMDTPDVRTDLGNAFRFSGEPRKALEQYQIAQRQDPRHENSLFNEATLYAQVLNEPANAVRALQDYLQRFPNGEKAASAREILQQLDLRAVGGGPQKSPAELP